MVAVSKPIITNDRFRSPSLPTVLALQITSTNGLPEAYLTRGCVTAWGEDNLKMDRSPKPRL